MGNLPYSADENDIADLFVECGVQDIYIVKDRETGDRKVIFISQQLQIRHIAS